MYHDFNFARQSSPMLTHSMPTYNNMHDESICSSSSHYTALLITYADSWTPMYYPSTARICKHFRCRADTANHHRFFNYSTTRSMTDGRPCAFDRIRVKPISGP
jgi:hypothetical protein